MLYMDTYALQNMQDRVRRILRIKNYATLKDGEIVVRIPEIKGRMTGHETSSGEEIITYIYQRWYDKEAKQMRNRKADIGKVVPWYSTAMYPTDRYEDFFDMETGKLKHPPEDEEMPADEQDVKKEQQINRILAEIREAYGGSNYEDLLGMIEEPKEEEQDGKTVMTGMTYSDAEIVLAHYAAITKFIRIKKLEDLKT